MFKDTTSPVPLEEKGCVISPSPPEVWPQIDSRNLPTLSFKPTWQSCSKQCCLRPQRCDGNGEMHLLRIGAGAWACSTENAISTFSWNHAPSPGTILAFFFLPLTSLLSVVTIWRKKKSRGISYSLTTKEFLNYVLWSSKEYVLL